MGRAARFDRATYPSAYPRSVDLSAIPQKQFVTLTLQGHEELFAELHVYGLRLGRPTLLVYNDQADPAWQLIDVRQVDDVEDVAESLHDARAANGPGPGRN